MKYFLLKFILMKIYLSSIKWASIDLIFNSKSRKILYSPILSLKTSPKGSPIKSAKKSPKKSYNKIASLSPKRLFKSNTSLNTLAYLNKSWKTTKL